MGHYLFELQLLILCCVYAWSTKTCLKIIAVSMISRFYFIADQEIVLLHVGFRTCEDISDIWRSRCLTSGCIGGDTPPRLEAEERTCAIAKHHEAGKE